MQNVLFQYKLEYITHTMWFVLPKVMRFKYNLTIFVSDTIFTNRLLMSYRHHGGRFDGRVDIVGVLDGIKDRLCCVFRQWDTQRVQRAGTVTNN